MQRTFDFVVGRAVHERTNLGVRINLRVASMYNINEKHITRTRESVGRPPVRGRVTYYVHKRQAYVDTELNTYLTQEGLSLHVVADLSELERKSIGPGNEGWIRNEKNWFGVHSTSRLSLSSWHTSETHPYRVRWRVETAF